MPTLEEANKRYEEEMKNLEASVEAIIANPYSNPTALEKTNESINHIREAWNSFDDTVKTQHGAEFCDKAIRRFADAALRYSQKLILQKFQPEYEKEKATLQQYIKQYAKDSSTPSQTSVLSKPAPSRPDISSTPVTPPMPEPDVPSQSADIAVSEPDTPSAPSAPEKNVIVPPPPETKPAAKKTPPDEEPDIEDDDDGIDDGGDGGMDTVFHDTSLTWYKRYFAKTEKFGTRLSPYAISELNKNIRVLLVFEDDKGRQFAFGEKITFDESHEFSYKLLNLFNKSGIYTTSVRCHDMPFIYIKNTVKEEKDELLRHFCDLKGNPNYGEIIMKIFRDKDCGENEAIFSIEIKLEKDNYSFSINTKNNTETSFRFNSERRFQKPETYELSRNIDNENKERLKLRIQLELL